MEFQSEEVGQPTGLPHHPVAACLSGAGDQCAHGGDSVPCAPARGRPGVPERPGLRAVRQLVRFL